ncbi:hypothetical protein NKH77_48865 [Streptomyces sp. M19]
MRSHLSLRIARAALLTVLYLFLLAPIIVIAIESFDDATFLRFPPEGFTFDAYRQAFTNADFREGLQVSAVTAAVTTLLALLAGVPAALALSRGRFRAATRWSPRSSRRCWSRTSCSGWPCWCCSRRSR